MLPDARGPPRDRAAPIMVSLEVVASALVEGEVEVPVPVADLSTGLAARTEEYSITAMSNVVTVPLKVTLTGLNEGADPYFNAKLATTHTLELNDQDGIEVNIELSCWSAIHPLPVGYVVSS